MQVCVSVCGQDLVMGSDAAGEKIKDHVKQLAPLLQDKSISPNDKIRLILLYVIQKGGTCISGSALCHTANRWHTSHDALVVFQPSAWRIHSVFLLHSALCWLFQHPAIHCHWLHVYFFLHNYVYMFMCDVCLFTSGFLCLFPSSRQYQNHNVGLNSEGQEGRLSELFHAMLCTTFVHSDSHTYVSSSNGFIIRFSFSFLFCFFV